MSHSTILHVEDDDASAFLLQTALKQAAIPSSLFRVSNGAEALAFLFKVGHYAQAQTPAHVFLDLHLPRINGWSVLSTINSREQLRSIKVSILSSSESAADRERALQMGAGHYLVKHQNIAVLAEQVKSIWQGARQVCAGAGL